MKFESEENTKLTIEKCRVYCEKINGLTMSHHSLDANETEDASLATTTLTDASASGQQPDIASEEIILNTLRNTFHEKKEIKVIFIFIHLFLFN